MAFPPVLSADEAAGVIPDGAVVTVSSSSGLGCPDAVLAAIGRRFESAGHPRGLTTPHPIAAGDMWGIGGVDHIAKAGCLAPLIAGPYPPRPAKTQPPPNCRRISGGENPAHNNPARLLLDTHPA